MKREELKEALYKKLGCDMQHDGWPCGTCFFSIDDSLTNQDWQALLFFRGDYRRGFFLPLDCQGFMQIAYVI